MTHTCRCGRQRTFVQRAPYLSENRLGDFFPFGQIPPLGQLQRTTLPLSARTLFIASAGRGPQHKGWLAGGCCRCRCSRLHKKTHPLHISIICPVMPANAVVDHFTEFGEKKVFFACLCRVSHGKATLFENWGSW